MEELVVRVNCVHDNWPVTQEAIERISAIYSGNCKLRIELNLTLTQKILQSLRGNSTSCKNAPENT